MKGPILKPPSSAVYCRGKVVTEDSGLVMVRGRQTTSHKLCRWEFMVLHITQFIYSMVNTCPAKCRTIFVVLHVMPFLTSFELATSQEKNWIIALTSIRILQNILQVLHLLPHVQQGTPTKFVGGQVVECPVSHIW